MSKIILQCVKVKNKLRIRFYSFIDEKGKSYINAYNNNYNCRFPRNIRKEGLFYEIKSDDLKLVITSKKPFYNIKKNNIKIIEPGDFMTPKIIYDVNECVICMENETSKILVPCGHACLCESCYNDFKGSISDCPLCRRSITHVIDKN